MLHLTFRQLSVFEAVARHLSFSRAAEALHLSQPAVSMQIKQLEDNLGIALFEQMGKKIYLTEAGCEIRNYSRSIAQQLNEIETVLLRLKGMEHGNLKISVASTANYFATQLLASFSQRHPQIKISLDVTNRETLLHQLANNEVDMVIMGQPPAGNDLNAESFMENPLVVIAPPQHPLTNKSAITLTELQDETFLLRESGSGTRNAMERFFNTHGIAPKTSMVMNSNEAIKQAVQAGLGLGVVSLHTLEMELALKRLTVLNVVDFPIVRHWYVVHREGKRLSTVATAFKEFLLQEANSLIKTISS